MPEFTFDFTTSGRITIDAPTIGAAQTIAYIALDIEGHPDKRILRIDYDTINPEPQSTPQTRMDAAGMVFRYRNMLAQSAPMSPERRALQDIVNAFIPGNTPQHAINLARGVIYEVLDGLSTADIPDALRARAAREAAVYSEFLEFTQPQ